MLIATQLNAPKTVFSKVSAKELQIKLNKLPKGFPLPDIDEKIINIKGKYISPLWRNMNFYYKKIGYTGHGPYQLNNFTTSERSGLFLELMNNPILYFAKKIHPISGDIDTTFVKNNSNGIVLTDNYDLINAELEKNSEDKIKIVKFKPKNIEAKVFCKEETFLVFMQNYKNDWKAYVDNQEVNIFPVNYSVQGIKVPSGNHIIRFSFVNDRITKAFNLSSASFIFLLISILISLFKHNKY